MPQSLSNVIVHIVYGTKNRQPWLVDTDLRARLYEYKAVILRDKVDCPPILLNGIEDHLHILCRLSRKFAIKDVIEESKTETTKWLKKQSPHLKGFQWQRGYGIFSVSQSQLEHVRAYIRDQEKHHQKMSFQDEFRLLCKRHQVEIDERYVWD